MSRTNRSNKLFEQTRIATLGLQDLLAFGQLQPDGTYKVRNVTNSNFLNAIVISEQITHAELLALATASELVAGKNYTITDAVSGTLSLYIFAVSTSKLAEYGYDTTTGQVYSYDLATDTATNADNTGYINFTPQTAPAYQRGRVWYDSTTETLSVYDDISGTSVQLGQEEVLRARNSTGSTILNGAVVYVSGAQGQNPRVSLALANAESTSRVIGVATHNISNNSVGKITTFGIVGDLNTSAYNEGDVLYLSASVAGGFTTTRPSAPNQAVMVGTVIHAAVNDGKILVHTDNYGIGFGTANQVRGMNAAGTAEEYKTIQGTASQVEVLHTANTVTIGLPNAVTISGAMTAGSFVKSGGVSAQFLKADGTVDANAYFYTNAQVTGQALTGLSVSGSAVVSTDSILTGIGKLQNQINAVVGSVNFQGVWNASTNSPSLASGVGTKGYYYVVSVPGSTNLDGITDWKLGDWAIYDGTAWQKVDNTDAVVSVNGYTGIVTLAKADIGLGNVENTALSTWGGSGNITTLGTISSGVWNGTAIGDTYISSASTWNAKIGGSGTTGKLPKFTASGAIGDSIVSESGSTIRVQSTQASIELRSSGTASPYLDFYTSSSSLAATMYALDGGGLVIGIPSAEKLKLTSTELITFGATDTGEAHIFGGSGRFNGNLGIQTSPSDWISQYKAIDIGQSGFIYSRSDNDETSVGTNWYRNGAAQFVYKANGFASMHTQGSGVHTWYTAPSGTAGNTVTFASGMSLSATELITFGATDTGEAHIFGGSARVNGNLSAIGTVDESIRVSTTGTTNSASVIIENGNGISSLGYSYIRFVNSKTSSQDWRVGTYGDDNLSFVNATGSITPLVISTTGAATFSSSVTAASGIFNETASNPTAIIIRNRNQNQTWGLAVDATSVDDKYFALIDQTNGIVQLKVDASTGLSIFNGNIQAPTLKLTSVPTSSAGLSAGDIWNDSGTLKIV